MKIHLLSDVHLERGPYTLPPDLDFDVLVAAGDISDNPAQAIDFLRSIGKPVVMILGNHDYWSGDMHGLFGASKDAGTVDMADRLAEFKRLAAGTNIHVLEQESVVLEVKGKRTRFLGATLWTSYGNGNEALMKIGSYSMNDTAMIGAGSWIDASETNTATHQAWLKSINRFHESKPMERMFEPPIALDIHTNTVAWLERQLKNSGSWDHTVVVTHHWPSWDVMVAEGIVRTPEVALDPEYWIKNTYRPDREDLGVNRLAAYGSPMEALIKRYREQIDVWCCGHVHHSIDVALHGVRLTSNARGYSYHEEGSNRGDGCGTFDERKIIDLDAGVMPALLPKINRAAKEIDALTDELGLLLNYVYDESDQYLLAIMRGTFDTCCREINQVAKKIVGHVNSSLQADGNYGLHEVISFSGVWARWEDRINEGFTTPIADPAGRAIRSARKFLSRLRKVHTKPKQFKRVQAYLIAKAIRRLEARGVRVRMDKGSRQFLDANVFMHIEDANGLTPKELQKIAGLYSEPGRYRRSLFQMIT